MQQLPPSFIAFEKGRHLSPSLLASLDALDSRLLLRNLEMVQSAFAQSPQTLLEKDSLTYVYYALSLLPRNDALGHSITEFAAKFCVQAARRCMLGDDRVLCNWALFFLFMAVQRAGQGGNGSKVLKRTAGDSQLLLVTQLHKRSLAVLAECVESELAHDHTVTKYVCESLFAILENRLLAKDAAAREQLYAAVLRLIARDPNVLHFVQSKVVNLIYEDEGVVQ